MPRDQMTQCEQKRQYMVDEAINKREWRWKIVDVARAVLMPQSTIRCMHCRGGLRTRKQRTADGPQHLAEHLLKQDSENCKGGHAFKGTHRMSTQPVK